MIEKKINNYFKKMKRNGFVKCSCGCGAKIRVSSFAIREIHNNIIEIIGK